MACHWKSGPRRKTQNFPEISYFDVHCCFLKHTWHTLVHNINSKDYTAAALNSLPCPSLHPLPLLQSVGFTFAETCHSSDMQRGVLRGTLWVPLWQQSLGTARPSLLRRSPHSPSTGAGVWLHQKLCRAPGAASLAPTVIPMSAKWDSEKRYQRPQRLFWQSSVSTTHAHRPAPQLEAAARLLLCIHQAKPCAHTKPSAPVRAPALQFAAGVPPHLTCWKKNRFHFSFQGFLWKQCKIPRRGLQHNRGIKMPEVWNIPRVLTQALTQLLSELGWGAASPASTQISK